jgi:hypothetical protein
MFTDSFLSKKGIQQRQWYKTSGLSNKHTCSISTFCKRMTLKKSIRFLQDSFAMADFDARAETPDKYLQ